MRHLLVPPKRLVLAAAAALSLAVAPAQAQDPAPYVGLGLGAAFNGTADLSGTGVNGDADLDTSAMGAMTVGLPFANGFRTEAELGYRDNGVDSVGGANASGNAKAWSLLLNGLYDFKIDNTDFVPYIGLGLGYANVDYGSVAPVGGSTVNDSDGAFAYQAIAGVSRALTGTTSLFADYRYFVANNVETRTASGIAVSGDYDNHTVMVGLRFSLGTPPKPVPEPTPVAAPPPKPAPVPVAPMAEEHVVEPKPVVRAYMVFFDWDKATLSPEAVDILRTAAENARNGGISRIAVTGHADRSGPAIYNMGLSKRRADAVLAELRHLGLTDQDIASAWKGESEPLVATEDGVREPQNRRVEIVFP